MLRKLTRQENDRIDRLLNSMTAEEKIGQTLCPVLWNLGGQVADASNAGEIIDRFKRRVEKYHVGCAFMAYGKEAAFLRIDRALKSLAGIPIVVCGDLGNGAGGLVQGKVRFPSPMACGATDNEAYAAIMGEAVAAESRIYGMQWALDPIVELCRNPNNAMTFSRAYGGDPDHVGRMTAAFIRALQKNGRVAATAKHFPGDGYDDRDPHMCTPAPDISRKQWMASYGRSWKNAIEAGAMAVMTGHIALPFVDPADSYLGPRPATLSRRIQLDFLRGELGFNGLIVCDAATMIGFAAHVPPRDRAWRSIEAGTDVHLFSNVETDFPNMLAALREGRLSEERLEFAARKVLELKTRVRLFDDVDMPAPTAADLARFRKAAVSVAEHSIVVVRDALDTLPLKLKKGSRVLTITCRLTEGARHGIVDDLPVVDMELKARGFRVTHLFNPWAPDYRDQYDRYEAIFVNFNFPPKYGYNRLAPPASNPLWEAFWVGRRNVVFTSFGNPFLMRETPSVPNMVLTFCNSGYSQAAAVRTWLGEIKPRGRCPVSLPGFFESGV